jgi:AraC-like DNA-binding protein
VLQLEYVDIVLLAGLHQSPAVHACVRHAWDRLIASSGRTSMTSIKRDIGCSQRHLITQFKREIGVTPKVLARMLRFSEATRAMQTGHVTSLADVALRSGYYDQSHFNRDARQFAGTTPGELLASLRKHRGSRALLG